jgi:hypothetical protein
LAKSTFLMKSLQNSSKPLKNAKNAHFDLFWTLGGRFEGRRVVWDRSEGSGGGLGVGLRPSWKKYADSGVFPLLRYGFLGYGMRGPGARLLIERTIGHKLVGFSHYFSNN